jgi:hypothetical protein
MTGTDDPMQTLLDEFGYYYMADELPSDLEDFLFRAESSATRIVVDTGERASEVVDLLDVMSEDRWHPLFTMIEARSQLSWNGDDRTWRTFQTLAGRICDDIRSRSAGRGH